jgi:hypothetical protein
MGKLTITVEEQDVVAAVDRLRDHVTSMEAAIVDVRDTVTYNNLSAAIFEASQRLGRLQQAIHIARHGGAVFADH